MLRGKRLVQAGADDDLQTRLHDAAERSLYVLCKGIFGMSKFVPHLHLPVCNWLQTVPSKNKVYLAPRSTFKTSIARCMAIHMIIQKPGSNPYFPGKDGRNLRILFAAENDKRALSRIGWIRRQFENHEIFRALFPEVVWGELKDAPTWQAGRFSVPRTEDFPEATIESAGVDSGSTGGHYDASVKDDLVGLRARQKPELMKTAIEWFKDSHSLTDDILESLDFVLGTRWAADDLYSYMLEFEPLYDWKVLSAHVNGESAAWLHKKEGSLLFPERLTEETLEELRKKQGPIYWLNYENKSIGEGTTTFNIAYLNLCSVDRSTKIITYDDIPQLTKRTLEVIEGKEIYSATPPRPKRFYEMTGEERSQKFNEMISRWHSDKISSIERT